MFGFAACSRDGAVKLWDVKSATAVHTWKCDAPAHCTHVDASGAFHHEPATTAANASQKEVGTAGKTVLVGTKDGTVQVFDLRARTPVTSLAGHAGSVDAVTELGFGGSAPRFVCGDSSGIVSLWDARFTRCVWFVV